MFRMLPGFAPPANSHSIPTNPARSLEFTVNGTSDDTNNTRIDGVSTAHVQLPHVVSYIPTLESIEEVNIVTNSMDAEQGLAGGAAINVQTRSGTNVMHGSGFEYFTNQHLKAWPMRFDDAALNTGDKPDASYQPVRRDRGRADRARTSCSTSSATRARGTTGRSTTRWLYRCRRCSAATCRGRPRPSTIRSPATRTAPTARSSRCSLATRTTRSAITPTTRSA